MRVVWFPLAVAAGLLAPVGIAGVRAAPAAAPSPIRGYQRWTKVNRELSYISAFASSLCGAAYQTKKPESPHEGRAITVYVNRAGRKALFTQAHPDFPAGTVLVKEKRLLGSKKLELMTVMERTADASKTGGERWNYSVYNPAGERIDAEKTAHCRSCHERVKGTDYVFRSYLPQDVRRRLK